MASTDWQESIAADEELRHGALAAQLTELQRRKSLKYGNGRALHRKQVQALRGELETLRNLPAHAAHGLFATAQKFPVQIRLSNGAASVQSDRTPDIRGFGIRVLGATGESALGGPAKAQDFVLIDRETFGFKNSELFGGLVLAASKNPALVPLFLVKRLGIVAGFKQLRLLLKSQSQPFHGFGRMQFFSAAPIACGPHAVRVRLMPHATGEAPVRGDWRADIRTHAAAAITYDLQLQFFVDEKATPIEDASVNWDEKIAPYMTVARLTVAAQTFDDAAAQMFANEVEAASFDPWEALAAHRPLGEVMRSRKAAYFASQKQRATT